MTSATTSTLTSAAQDLNRVKRRSSLLRATIRLARAFILAGVTVSIWSLVRPGEELTQLALGTLVLVLALAAALRRMRRQRIAIDALGLALEMRYGKSTGKALDTTRPDEALPDEWRPHVEGEIAELRRYEGRRNLALASTLVLPMLVASVTLPAAAPSFKMALSEVSNVVSMLARGASLRVVSGAATEMPDGPISLSAGDPTELELLSQNLIEISVTGGGFGRQAPVVELRRPVDKDGAAGATAPVVFQTFQLMPIRGDATNEEQATQYTISFAVTEPVDLHIPTLDDAPFAHIKVRQLPIPKVRLEATTQLQDPWPDDQPLPLRISVKAENPLQTVRLLIKSGQRISKELVANVVAEDKQELTTDYRLVLETYVESDLAQVEIVAEATDRAVPTPLVGYSEPLRLNTASAYGRYRQALETLKELKKHVDEAVAKQQRQLPKEAQELARKAGDQSETSPFFDGLDRVQIHRFESRVQEFVQEPKPERMLELSQSLNEFLFEHEILDDRERDRDFFVAVRGLSRLIEQEPEKRPVGVKVVTDRLKKFLDDRHGRWEKRVERLAPEFRPAKWDEVKKKPFHATMNEIDRLEGDPRGPVAAKSDQLTALSKSVVEYRAFIEDLEAKEDKMRDAEEKERQEGLASARDTLRELQKRQGEVSGELDRAGERSKSDLDTQWPATRMKQNANSKETRQLEGQMRSLSPQANERIRAAIEAMEGTSQYGESGNYQLAESASDLAGRLLRQAESDAQQSQQKRRSRGRRRRVTGDNYYGQSVVGGDIEIKREYQVDRRYREDILDEVQSSSFDEENRTLLESYLRHVVR